MKAKAAAIVAAVAVLLALYARYAPDPSVGVRFHYTDSADEHPVLVNSFGLYNLTLPGGEAGLGIIVEGYTGSALADWALELGHALLRRGRVGAVLYVDYYHLTTINRPAMNDNVERVAKTLARFFDHLATERNFRLSRVHVLCFSMGGRVLGAVESHLNTREKIGRITAMDPSTPWPGYHNRGAAGQLLDDGDAAVVVVLRTSVVSSRLGSVERDFVFNGGVLQTGCYRWYWPQFVINICSHYRVMALVTEAVLDDKAFPACGCGRVGCPHCASPVYFMSEAKIPPGKYYINTSGTSPYSLHRSRPASLEV